MREEFGLAALLNGQKRPLSKQKLSELLLKDLASCYGEIIGKTEAENPVLLVKLTLLADSLYYDMFDQRIDFTLVGDIISNQYVPLTYIVQGQKFSLRGRCSIIGQVCGVDLYLNSSYTEKIGDQVRQRFSISVKKLFKRVT